MELTDLRAHLEARTSQITESENGLELPNGVGGIARPIKLKSHKLPSGSRWLGVSVTIGTLERVSLRGVLVANGELPVGALGIAGDDLVLRQTMPLDRLRPDQLDRTLEELAATTAQLARSAEREAETPYGFVFR